MQALVQMDDPFLRTCMLRTAGAVLLVDMCNRVVWCYQSRVQGTAALVTLKLRLLLILWHCIWFGGCDCISNSRQASSVCCTNLVCKRMCGAAHAVVFHNRKLHKRVSLLTDAFVCDCVCVWS